jgi:hypothetical protein
MTRTQRVLGVLLLLCVLESVTLFAAPVTGAVRTVTRAGTTPAIAVVYAEPIDGASPRLPRRLSLGQKNKTFQPRVLAAPLGSSVDFPNNDAIYHNVFSLSGPQPFDLGLYRAGDSRTRTFTTPGTYRVFCNIHPQMTAIIVVAPTAFTASADADGRFMLDLPPGRYRLTAISERAPAVSVEIAVGSGALAGAELTLDESAWVFSQHKDKFGKDYPTAAYQR